MLFVLQTQTGKVYACACNRACAFVFVKYRLNIQFRMNKSYTAS